MGTGKLSACRAACACFTLLAALGGSVLAEDSPAVEPADPWVSGRILLMLAEPGADALKAGGAPHGDPAGDEAPPQFLRALGVERLAPVLPRRRAPPGAAPGARTGLGVRAAAGRFGLDRVYVAEVAPGADLEALSRALESDPRVRWAHPDYLGRGGGAALPFTDDPYFAEGWHLRNVGQTGGSDNADMDVTEAWTTTVGRPETLIAVLDTGIDGDHPEFRNRIARGGIDLVNDDDDPEADHNHGTRVAGIIGANPNNGFSVAGVHWDATILPIKILNASNGGSTSDLAAGLIHAADAGADVANLSLIHFPNTPTLQLAVQYAHAAGVILIGCNGNDGIGQPNYPASYPEVVSTGWSDDDDRRDAFSNFTGTLDVMAPGRDIRTVVHNSTINGRAFFSGCSAATPGVVGVVGLLRALDPTLTQEQVTQILRTTADDQVGTPAEDIPGRDDFYGWGRVNARRALDALGPAPAGRIHVHDIVLRRVSGNRLDVQVTVLDDLRGVEPGVTVEGLLTPPGGAPLPLTAATAGHGVATLSYLPGAALPAGRFAFEVTSLSLDGGVYDPAANRATQATHDPALSGLHVGALWAEDTFDTLVVDVRVDDDDGLHDDGAIVSATLSPPAGEPIDAAETARGARGGVARFVFAPPPGVESFAPGAYAFQVTELARPGFVHEPDRDADAGLIVHVVGDPAADGDADGIPGAADNCRLVANAEQADADGDGIGDACDVCPALFDPAQRDADGDGAGDRCDCAPWDAAAVAPGVLLSLRADAGGLSWDAVPGADAYDVTRGDLGAFDGARLGVCVAEDLQGRAVDLQGQDPPPGEGFFYLVRADDALCGTGPFGADGAGTPRVSADPQGCGSASAASRSPLPTRFSLR